MNYFFQNLVFLVLIDIYLSIIYNRLSKKKQVIILTTRNAHHIYNKYIDLLLRNELNAPSPLLEDLFNRKDYEYLLKPVLNIIKENPQASLTTLRLKLFLRSGLKEIIDNFVNLTKITPGVILDFGTYKTRDTVLCGKRQEYVMENGILVPNELDIEQDTIFDLASTSKLFTSVAILKVYETGLIDIFDPINKYVPEFKNLEDVTVYELLKFSANIGTDTRIDSAKNKEEAEQILFGAHKRYEHLNNAYTDIGAMILRYVVERVTNMSFVDFVNAEIFKKADMVDTYLNVPEEKLYRVANENYSSIVNSDGSITTKYNNVPGTAHDSKALSMGHAMGIAPGHAGFFSTKDDMVKFANALIKGDIISKNLVMTMGDTATFFQEENGKYTYNYGSLVYGKQKDPKYLSVYAPLSGRAFMSPGFAGTTLVIDPVNELSLFIGANRLHNRIYQIHPNYKDKIIVDEHNKKTFLMPDGSEKIISADYTKEKEVMVRLALDLTLQYQLLEKIYPQEKEMHLVRELN